MFLEILIIAVVSGVTSAFFTWFWNRKFRGQARLRVGEELTRKIDALVAAALKLAVRDPSEVEEASLSFAEVTDRLLKDGVLTPESHAELMHLWEVRNHLEERLTEGDLSLADARLLATRAESLTSTLGKGSPS